MPAVLENTSYIEATVRTLVSGKICYTTMDYQSSVTDEIIDREDAADQIESALFTSDYWQDLISISATLVSLTIRSRGPFAGLTYVRPLGDVGNRTGQLMPTWDNWSALVPPDNETKYERPGATWVTPFKYGRINIPGISESDQEAGIPTPALSAAFAAFASSVHILPPGAVNGSLHLILNRYLEGATPPFQQRCNVFEPYFRTALGTQLTRK